MHRRVEPLVTSALLAVLYGCASGGRQAPPIVGVHTLRSYVLVIPLRGAFDSSLSTQLRQRGFRVRDGVRGGGNRAAALITFTFRDPSSESGRWLQARFFDTRTGLLVAAASVALDTLTDDLHVRARALVAALLLEP